MFTFYYSLFLLFLFISQITTAIPIRITITRIQIAELIPLDVLLSTLSLEASFPAFSAGASLFSGAAVFVGSSVGVLVFSGSGVGVLVFSGSGVGVLVFSGSGVGVLVFSGSGVGVLVFSGSGVGVLVFSGSGVGVLVFSGSGVGVLVFSGSGVGVLVFSGADALFSPTASVSSSFSPFSLCKEVLPVSAFPSFVSGISSTAFSSVLVACAISTHPDTSPASVFPQTPSLPVSTSVSIWSFSPLAILHPPDTVPYFYQVLYKEKLIRLLSHSQ